MRTFANLFLVLFFADASLSLLDELVSLISPFAPLSLFRAEIAELALILAAALYLCLMFDRRLPKKLFLPLILFLFWCPLSAWLIPSLAGFKLYGLAMAALQLLLGGWLRSRCRREGEPDRVTLPPDGWEGPAFSARNTLVFLAISVIVLPPTLVGLVLYGANAYASNATAGFMKVQPRGLYMTERVYRRDGRTVILKSMIHVGEKRYYEEVTRIPVSGRAIVLAEGVTDRKEVLRNKFDYGKVASYLGLTPQEKMLFSGKVIDEKALEAPPAGDGKGKAEGVDILRADVDLASFRPDTIFFLDAVGKHLRGNPSMVEAAVSLNDWAEEHITPQMYQVIMDDILHRRNEVLLAYLDKALKRYDTVVIPWGALHMKGIEAGVLERGFVLQEERKRLSVDLKRIISG